MKPVAQTGLIAAFARHAVAANILMVIMVVAGLWALSKLNRQMFPNIDLDWISVSIVWTGASAEDVEKSIAIPVEQELRTVDSVKQMITRAQDGVAAVYIELEEGSDTGKILDRIKQRVDRIRNLPRDSERPVVEQIETFDDVAVLIVSGPSLKELRPIARRFEHQLLQRGISKIAINGLPDEEIAVQINRQTLNDLGVSMPSLASMVAGRSVDLPAGTAGKNELATQLRTLGQQRTEAGFRDLPIMADANGQLLRLGDIADISRRPINGQALTFYQGRPAVELSLMRTKNDDTLESAEILNQWLADITPTLPPTIALDVYYERWQHLEERIDLLLKNGLSGLLLVIIVLFVFLNRRIAFWVTAGIPISIFAAMAVLFVAGGSINMISLFAIIMALGIVVDDAIVVGEDTLVHLEKGKTPLQAAVAGAQRMFLPVLSSSLTTIAAFLPLMLISGVMGKMVFEMPLIIICVIVASLIECFLILPGHLHHSVKNAGKLQQSRFHIWFNRHFNHFRDDIFRRWVERALEKRGAIIAGVFGLFFITITLLGSGRLPFVFFPTVDGDQIKASVQFAPGTPFNKIHVFLKHLEKTLAETDQEFGGGHVQTVLVHQRKAFFTSRGLQGDGSSNADELGSLIVEIPASDRHFTNNAFIKAWRDKIQLPDGVEKFIINQDIQGPPGKPIEIKLTGADVPVLKKAAEELKLALSRHDGPLNVDDDMPWGKEQLILSLTPQGHALGLSLDQVGQQIRAAVDGVRIQLFNEGQDEVDVRIMLPDEERFSLSQLEQLPIVTPTGQTIPLVNVVAFENRRGVNLLRRLDGELAVTVSADLDEARGNANEILKALSEKELPALQSTYGIRYGFEGKAKEQAQTFGDMGMGLLVGLLLIYLILAWVFASYFWPLAVMAAIPLGLTGAILGHLLLGMDMTFLSMMGLFGLSGIIVNDSIVLVTFYKDLKASGMSERDAIVEAVVRRLRPVLLTSLTTIAGLTPILFETSLQAQSLIPMAVSIVFGLAYGTLLILFFVPALLTVIEKQPAKAPAIAT